MTMKALDILDRVTRGRGRKEDRLTDLLRDPESDVTPGWFMHVPKCFNEALDIKKAPRVIDRKPQLVWTQGSLFAFKTGDIIYDTERAYEQWSQALRYIGVAVQVRKAVDATSSSPGASRIPGSVTFDVLVPTADRVRIVPTACRTVTQDEFIRLLITGDGLPRN